MPGLIRLPESRALHLVLPELWHRFTIALRRLIRRQLRDLGHDPKSVRVSYIKVVELQRRGVPHYHAVVRLDSIQDGEEAPMGPVPLTMVDLMLAVRQAVDNVRLDVPSLGGELVTLRFGEQTDVQPLRATSPPSEDDSIEHGDGDHDRRIASYLAKYVTKSVNEFGLTPRRFSPLAVETLDVRPHVRAILRTILDLAESPGPGEMVRWLHTFGYRGHITTKTLRYSTTMRALRARRAAWRALHATADGSTDNAADVQVNTDRVWEFVGAGHATDGDRLLALTAAARLREARQVAREELSSLEDEDRGGGHAD
ncbi:replication initiator [Nocardioides sp.]|uniref:replication initiator n=1 Tax=Nocardioides sp. TaxID=35761 RepID=UPI002C609007|nr:replication initiator [Nocardioides sp.]HVX55472.1 replication initiator [Nocardioides sp.]